MRNGRIVALVLTAVSLVLAPSLVFGFDLGNARLMDVVALDGGCVSGPTGSAVGTWAWDIEPGYTYRLTIGYVTDCANGGTDPTLDMRINSSIPGHEYTDLVATFVSTGVYEVDFTLPENAWCTLPILYCTVPGEWLTTGMFVRRPDGYQKQAHLRASTWSEGCTDPVMILGPECGAIGNEESSWGSVKMIYR
jgi:hypothetical protein